MVYFFNNHLHHLTLIDIVINNLVSVWGFSFTELSGGGGALAIHSTILVAGAGLTEA